MSEQGGSGVKRGNAGEGAKSPGGSSGSGDRAQALGGLGGRDEEPREQLRSGEGGRGVRAGWGQYLVAPRPLGMLAGGVPPIEASALFTLLEEDPEVEAVAQLRPSRSRGLGAIAGPRLACPPVAVVVMPAERARALAVNPQVVVESDQPLCYAPALPLGGVGAGGGLFLDPALAVPLEEPELLRVLVKGGDGEVLAGAHVWAVGAAATVHAVTGRDGRASLALTADTPATLRSLYVRPVSGYWPRRVNYPLGACQGQETVVELQSLADTFEGFPGRAVTGWGVRAMRLDQIPSACRGQGIKIALLDSGVDTAHPDLKDTLLTGHDFTRLSGEETWQRDLTGHGTWCAGILAAADNHTGITGIAPDAELYALKLFPNGHISDLLRAVDHCITHDIDVAQINLAYQAPSQLVAWKLHDANTAGITVIAPAGNTPGPLRHPAALPGVLAVGAITHTAAHPPHSPHPPTPPPCTGSYPAPFTPTGPGIDLVAPGTAVITTAPGDGYTPTDGTTIAAAHITALTALLLAHHDHLHTQAMPHTPTRPHQLHTLLRTACRPIPGTDPAHTGAGLPDAPTALTTPAPPNHPHNPHTQPMYATTTPGIYPAT
ncbi:S8 family serine peptidase [Streptomyces sp. NPDC003038]|uniref:S8 family serine peptidase n=1 Tax=unclassified Streptomyces TaxID=2593676 RepID=UPI0033AD9645